MVAATTPTLRYRGREITTADILYIRELVASSSGESRRTLSKKLCEPWGWKQANGALRDMVCRGLAADAGAGRRDRVAAGAPSNPRPVPDGTPAAASDADRHYAAGDALKELGPIEIQQVRRTADEPLFNSLMEQHHYLSYEQPVGEHLKYLVWAQGRPIACLAWSSAPRHLGSRDRYIGWSAEARRRNIRFIAYNTRFLILPWVRVPHLASHILGR